jgi:hypothetical protein
MRCKACNKGLEDHELTRKCKLSGDFLDLCSSCGYDSNEAIYSPTESSLYKHEIELQEEADFYQEELAL